MLTHSTASRYPISRASPAALNKENCPTSVGQHFSIIEDKKRKRLIGARSDGFLADRESVRFSVIEPGAGMDFSANEIFIFRSKLDPESCAVSAHLLVGPPSIRDKGRADKPLQPGPCMTNQHGRSVTAFDGAYRGGGSTDPKVPSNRYQRAERQLGYCRDMRIKQKSRHEKVRREPIRHFLRLRAAAVLADVR
jgi:hypothetical protein